MLKKCNPNGKIEFRPVCFNSTTKTVINHKFSLGESFQEILYRIDNYINEDILLPRICYVKLTAELRKPKKGLINTKKERSEMFFRVSC